MDERYHEGLFQGYAAIYGYMFPSLIPTGLKRVIKLQDSHMSQ